MGKRFRKMDVERERASSRECERLQNRKERVGETLSYKIDRENKQKEESLSK